jgi:kynurenine formamidase
VHIYFVVDDLEAALATAGHTLAAGDIVLLWTGADELWGTPAYLERYCGLGAESTRFLLDQGVRVIGCDAESLDGPSGPMVEAARAGRPEALFPIHYLGRDREFCLIHKLDLSRLDRQRGFKVAAFPVKLEGCGAAWTRAVALVKG